MSPRDSLSASERALLAELADERGLPGEDMTASARARAEELLARAPQEREQLGEQRALLAELRALPRDPSPNWQELEASIRRACAEVPSPRRGWLRWRWPVLALGTAMVAATAALLLRAAPAEPMELRAAASDGAPSGTGAPEALSDRATNATDATDAMNAQLADPVSSEPPAEADPLAEEREEREEREEQEERELRALVAELPQAEAVTLGLADGDRDEADDEADDDDELLPADNFADELERLDGDALRALEAWLDDPKQKG